VPFPAFNAQDPQCPPLSFLLGIKDFFDSSPQLVLRGAEEESIPTRGCKSSGWGSRRGLLSDSNWLEHAWPAGLESPVPKLGKKCK
jgi:hypothetical protein